MTIRKLDRDEWWPVYSFDDTYGREVDIPDDLYERYCAYAQTFDELQIELERLYEAAKAQDAA